jgi:hypothetical protein
MAHQSREGQELPPKKKNKKPSKATKLIPNHPKNSLYVALLLLELKNNL